MSADSPVTAYAIKQSNGKLEAAGEIFEAAPHGWPVKKDSPLAQSMLKALEHLIKTGDHKIIASNWGVEKGMLDKPGINGAINRALRQPSTRRPTAGRRGGSAAHRRGAPAHPWWWGCRHRRSGWVVRLRGRHQQGLRVVHLTRSICSTTGFCWGSGTPCS